MFDLFFPKHWSTLKKLIWLKAAALSSAVQKIVSGAIVHIKDALAGPAQNVTIAIEPVQAGTGDPSPDNVRPITGWTGCNIYHRGKNLFDEANATQYTRYISYINGNSAEWKSSGDSRSYAIEVIPGQTYTISLNANPQSTIFRVAAITVPPTTAGTIASTHAFSNSGNPVYEISFTMREGEKWLVIQVGKSFADERKAKIQVEAGSTHTDYEAYNAESTTIPITFPTPPGTVYGGTLDVVNGKFYAEYGYLERSSSSVASGTPVNSIQFRSVSPGATIDDTKITKGWCNMAKVATYGTGSAPKVYYTGGTVSGGNATFVFWPGRTFADKTEVDNWLADNHFQCVYPLHQPFTVDLTAQQITLLAGENTLWADAGDLSMTYMADGRASDIEALGILLAGRYVNHGAADEATDAEALEILLGGNR